MSDGIRILNDLLKSFGLTGLNQIIANEIVHPVTDGDEDVTFGSPSFMPTPDVTNGRLVSLQDAWLVSDGVTYPLTIENRNVFQSSYKYDPLKTLPLLAIVYFETDLTRIRLYGAPSQTYDLHVYGKFEFAEVGLLTNMSFIPRSYHRFLYFALARDLALWKSRQDAWTDKLEQRYNEALSNVIATSPVDLTIIEETPFMLNGSWRVEAGV
jgi:hypothetical protein